MHLSRKVLLPYSGGSHVVFGRRWPFGRVSDVLGSVLFLFKLFVLCYQYLRAYVDFEEE